MQAGVQSPPVSSSSIPGDSVQEEDGGSATVIIPAERTINGDPASSLMDSATVPRAVEASGERCEDQAGGEGQASPEVEKGAPSHLNWRGGSHKIKASRA